MNVRYIGVIEKKRKRKLSMAFEPRKSAKQNKKYEAAAAANRKSYKQYIMVYKNGYQIQ